MVHQKVGSRHITKHVGGNMKILFLGILITFSAQATDKWSNYQTDYCNVKKLEDSRYSRFGFNRCRDGSVSYTQPDSSDWEGRCGHTMASNMLYTICGRAVHPVSEFGDVFSDIGSGTTHRTVTSGLNIKFGQHRQICPNRKQASWWYIKLGNATNYIRSLKSYLTPVYSTKNMTKISRNGKSYYRNPVGVMVKNPGGGLHWVTVVDYTQKNGRCHFVVNHWDNQYTIPCTTLASWAGKVRSVFPYVMSNYLVVVFKD